MRAVRPAVRDSTVMPSVKRKAHLERQLDVYGARQEREHAKKEADQETEQIKIRPVHKTPRFLAQGLQARLLYSGLASTSPETRHKTTLTPCSRLLRDRGTR